MSDQLRVGVVGCGRMGAFHVRNYAQIDCAQLVAVADPDPEARARALSGSQALEFSDWRDMIEDADELDAISIACPSPVRSRWNRAARIACVAFRPTMRSAIVAGE